MISQLRDSWSTLCHAAMHSMDATHQNLPMETSELRCFIFFGFIIVLVSLMHIAWNLVTCTMVFSGSCLNKIFPLLHLINPMLMLAMEHLWLFSIDREKRKANPQRVWSYIVMCADDLWIGVHWMAYLLTLLPFCLGILPVVRITLPRSVSKTLSGPAPLMHKRYSLPIPRQIKLSKRQNTHDMFMLILQNLLCVLSLLLRFTFLVV